MPPPVARRGWARKPAAPTATCVGQLVMAAKQIGMGGDPAQVEAATGILTDARRKLYQLLAES